MSDLVILAQPGALDQYTDAEIIDHCERAKNRLAQCIAEGRIGDLVDLKSRAELLRVRTSANQPGREAELAAIEVVRRAERGIGVCIRRGQAEGKIRKPGDVGGNRRRAEAVRVQLLPSPYQFVSKYDLGNGIYEMTDGVTDEQFDEAIRQAKAEGNLSRANVIRKLSGDKIDRAIDALGKTRPSSRLAFPQPSRMGGSRRKQCQQIEALITSLSGALIAFECVEVLDDSVTAEEAGVLSADLSKQIQAISRINRLLRERTS